MFQHQGIWLPDGEKHFPDWMTRNGEMVDGKGTYQIKKFREAMKNVKQFRTAVDVGAHVGLWSMQLMKSFHRVEAFEPMIEFRECWMKNIVPRAERITILNDCALGSCKGSVNIVYDPKDSGGTHVGSTGRESLVLPLDSFGFNAVDFIKIDCEGYELEVLRGAEFTIKTQKPTIIVEQKPHKLQENYGTKGAPAVDFLKGLGYTVAREMSGDYIMVHP